MIWSASLIKGLTESTDAWLIIPWGGCGSDTSSVSGFFLRAVLLPTSISVDETGVIDVATSLFSTSWEEGSGGVAGDFILRGSDLAACSCRGLALGGSNELSI